MTRQVPRSALQFASWWVVLFAGYLVLVASVTVAEAVVGALLAAAAAVVAVAASRAFRPASAPPPLRWRHALWLPVDMIAETIAIVGFVARYVATRGRAHGSAAEVTLAAQRAAPTSSLRAYGVLLLSLTPGGYVADDRIEREPADRHAVVVRVHRIGRSGRFTKVVEK